MTASEVVGNFGTIINNGSSSQSHDNDIEYHATMRALDTGLNINGQTVEINFIVIASGVHQTQSSLALKVSC